MMQFRKLSIKNLEVGSIYVAYSGRNKHLSRNGDKGVFVKLLSTTGENIKVQVLGTLTETAIAKLDTREDAWIYDPAGAEIQVVARIADKQAWPGFSPRMESEGWDGKVFTFKDDELFVVEDMEGEREQYNGITLLRHEGETIDPDEDMPYVNTFLMSNIYPVEPPEWRVPRAQRMGIGAVELPLPPKPVAEQHNAIIEALSPLAALVQSKHTRENVSFIKAAADYSVVAEYYNQVCHRTIQCNEDRPVAYVITTGRNNCGSHWVKGYASEEAERLWVTYLTGYSPYADVFITKDPDFILENGYIIDASKPARLVAAACYATRQVWEKSPRLEAFYKLYEAGVPMHLAFVFGSQCSEFAQGKMKFAQAGSNHSHLYSAHLSDSCIINFVDGKPAYPGKPYNKKPEASDNSVHGGQDGVDGMWSADFRKKPSKMFERLREIKGTGAWGGGVNIDIAIEKAADMIEDWAQTNGV